MIQIRDLTLPPSREQRGCNEAIMQLAKPDPTPAPADSVNRSAQRAMTIEDYL